MNPYDEAIAHMRLRVHDIRQLARDYALAGASDGALHALAVASELERIIDDAVSDED